MLRHTLVPNIVVVVISLTACAIYISGEFIFYFCVLQGKDSTKRNCKVIHHVFEVIALARIKIINHTKNDKVVYLTTENFFFYYQQTFCSLVNVY